MQLIVLPLTAQLQMSQRDPHDVVSGFPWLYLYSNPANDSPFLEFSRFLLTCLLSLWFLLLPGTTFFSLYFFSFMCGAGDTVQDPAHSRQVTCS